MDINKSTFLNSQFSNLQCTHLLVQKSNRIAILTCDNTRRTRSPVRHVFETLLKLGKLPIAHLGTKILYRLGNSLAQIGIGLSKGRHAIGKAQQVSGN